MNNNLEIDWDKLQLEFSELQRTIQTNPPSSIKNSRKVTKLIYLLETSFHKIKKDLELPQLNPSIYSDSVVQSLHDTKPHNGYQSFTFYDPIDFLRPVDYQYWLLIFLLIRNNYIYQNHITLFQIIDEFVCRVQNESFSFKDIALTGSGATRCKTNLRFAFKDLKLMGLVIDDKKYKNCWRLTFLGFFTAASFCLWPIDKLEKPFSTHITSFLEPAIYGTNFNSCIKEKVLQLSNPENFSHLINTLGLQDDESIELKKGPEIFKSYWNALSERPVQNKKKASSDALANFIANVNLAHNLSAYMEELSEKFNGDAFIENLLSKAFSSK
ncbi:MAG: hypothetical protein ACM3U0_02290 [archaeon]